MNMTLHTEEEAGDMRCCGPSGCGKQTVHSEQQWCIASGCMAWRWSRAKETKGYLEAVQERMKETGEDFKKASGKVFENAELFENTEGYCGLAGKP